MSTNRPKHKIHRTLVENPNEYVHGALMNHAFWPGMSSEPTAACPRCGMSWENTTNPDQSTWVLSNDGSKHLIEVLARDGEDVTYISTFAPETPGYTWHDAGEGPRGARYWIPEPVE